MAKDNTRSLQTVCDILSDPAKLDLAVKLMCESGGMLARLGGQLLHFVDREKGSVLTSISRHTGFLNTPAIAESTKASSFDPSDLRRGKMTIYVVLSPEHMRAQSSGWLRLVIGSLLLAIVRGGLQEENNTHFILDEAASLGHLECLDDAVDKYRGYGVRLQFYFQSLGQLRKCFPDGQEQTLLSNTTQVFFGVNDPQTADLVSTRLGEHTVIVESGGTNSGGNRSQSFNNSSSGTSHGRNTGWQQMARKLLKPEEVIALPPREAITFTPGVPPIRTTLLRYYEENFRRSGLRRSLAACATLTASFVYLVLSLLLAIVLTLALNS